MAAKKTFLAHQDVNVEGIRSLSLISSQMLICSACPEHIQPSKPQQNAYVERFNRTVRYEWLSQYHWCDLDEVREFATQWMWRYNHERPNMALGGITPKQRLAMAA
jgi:transposase InsO family protein